MDQLPAPLDPAGVHPAEEAARLLVPTLATYTRLAATVLGVVPWVGAYLSVGASLAAEREQSAMNQALLRWLDVHEARFDALQASLTRVVREVEAAGEHARERLSDEAFLPLVRRAYQGWDRAQTDAKRARFERLLVNAAARRSEGWSEPDRLRLFVEWIERYDDAHIAIVAAVHAHPGLTRLGIWRAVGPRGPLPREDSSDADLFRMLVHDLSLGRVMRQRRAVTSAGQFQRKGRTRGTGGVLESSFDDRDPYELSALGRDFVGFVLESPTARIPHAP